MGCQQSTPVEGRGPKTTSGKSFHGDIAPGTRKTTGQTERLLSSKNRRAAANPQAAGGEREPPKLTSAGQLMPEEIVKRTKYPHKANQDDYSITHKFGGENGDIMFGVYDGHGEEGHTCAAFARKNIPALMEKYVRKKRVARYQAALKAKGASTKGSYNPRMWPKLSTADYEECCEKSFVECNEKMHANEKVQDKLSGTTAITACFHFGRLTVCNVGDSRAVLGHRVSDGEEEKTEITATPQTTTTAGQLVAIPLSKDQTPYRKDERERVKKCGAAIMNVDQMEGNAPMNEDWGDLNLGSEIDLVGNPPRVWKQGESYPGCAFTRSLGDNIADKIGVCAEPEMLTKELTKDDEVLVVASDGIFEFLTNQGVIDMCAECDSPLEACERLVKASYSQWMHYEDRTDDITVIVVFMKCDAPSAPDSSTNVTNELLTTSKHKVEHSHRKPKEGQKVERNLPLFLNPGDVSESAEA